MIFRPAWMNTSRLIDVAKNNVDFLAILCLGIIVRAWAFGDIPSGFNQDEASTAYDAFALLHYGIDRNGFSFPLFLVAWGSSMQALPAYLAIPFMAVFGTTVFAARFASLLLGIASIGFLYALVRLLVDRPTAIIAMLLMAISPGHIMLSRWAHEACYFPGFFLAGTLLLALSLRRPNMLYASAIVFGLSLYTYASAYLVVPVYLAVIAMYMAIHRQWPAKHYLGVGTILVVLALPLALFLLINTYDWPSIVTPIASIPNLPTAPRYESMVNLPFINPDFFQTSWENLQNAFDLLVSQNDGLIWNVIPEFGVLYLFNVPASVESLRFSAATFS